MSRGLKYSLSYRLFNSKHCKIMAKPHNGGVSKAQQSHTHTYMHIYIYTHMYVYIHTYIHTYIHIRVQFWIRSGTGFWARFPVGGGVGVFWFKEGGAHQETFPGGEGFWSARASPGKLKFMVFPFVLGQSAQPCNFGYRNSYIQNYMAPLIVVKQMETQSF